MTDQSKTETKLNYCMLLFAIGGILNLLGIFLIVLFWNSAPIATNHNFDALSISVTTIEVALVITAIVGFWTVRESAAGQAREVAQKEAGQLITKYLEENGETLIRSALEETEIISMLDAAFQDSMIDNSASADYVDDDAMWKPE